MFLQRRVRFTCFIGVLLHVSRAPPCSAFVPTAIEDATCNVQDLEAANDSQLHSILHDLRETPFFSHFKVNLNRQCPLTKDGEDSALEHTSHAEDDFECASGPDSEFDTDLLGPSLCSVMDASPTIDSKALFSLSQDGFQSQSQKETYTWQQHSNQVVQESQQQPTIDCVDETEEDSLLPDTFWLDVCKPFQEDKEVVNLKLNPERNTAYNGTHIWKAIYEENCVVVEDMCFEERVLYRLFSGLHSSTTLSIAKYYYPPSKRKGRLTWEANPSYFMEKFQNHPDYIRNLHFSYVVLLRALRKASDYLRDYSYTHNQVHDHKATVLLHRLLDSAILQSCSSVFEAFDESLMFSSSESKSMLQQNFKGVFHNVSSILDCVQCQQCKLHGKLAMLGYGTALKILFVKPENLLLSKNEVVAFINTLAKFSESIREVRELTDLYWADQKTNLDVNGVDLLSEDELVDVAVGLIAERGRQGRLVWSQEQELVKVALQRQKDLLILAKHYGSDTDRFWAMLSSTTSYFPEGNENPDAIIVGSGLAGLAAALNILDRGGRVVIIEKEHLLGGNSNKASSGINAYIDAEAEGDSAEIFKNDTIRSAGASMRQDLINTLVDKSGDAVTWLRDRVGVDLSLKSQLGGHSAKRTHRPKNGMAGAEIIYGMQRAVKSYEKSGKVQILLDSKVVNLISDDDGAVVGVEYVPVNDPASPSVKIFAPNTILATGGFAADRSENSLLRKYRPEYINIPTTAGAFSTGDGVALATSLGAGITDMDKIQIHPTGWIDPSNPEDTTKTLAAELMRGVGGILLNSSGERFCNELGTRSYVTDRMLAHDPKYKSTGKWDVNSTLPTFFLVLSSSAAEDGRKHVDLYSHKGLMTRLEGLSALSKWMKVPKSSLEATFIQYQKDSEAGSDSFGKTVFRGVPMKDLDREVFYVGRTTPVAHYCMGGITIDASGSVLDSEGRAIVGLHAAGEVTGGVHGVNRLAGNSLLECTVYGTIVGQKIPIESRTSGDTRGRNDSIPNPTKSTKEDRPVTISELSQHSAPDDCWVAIHGVVYDLTQFAEEHPAGPASILDLAGKDGTAAFSAVHNERIMEDFVDERIGILIVEEDQDSIEDEEDCSACQVQMEPFPFS